MGRPLTITTMTNATNTPARFCAACEPTATSCGQPMIEFGEWTETPAYEEQHLTTFRCGEPPEDIVVVDLRFEPDGGLELC